MHFVPFLQRHYIIVFDVGVLECDCSGDPLLAGRKLSQEKRGRKKKAPVFV